MSASETSRPDPADLPVGSEMLARFFKAYDGYPPRDFSEVVARHSKAVRRVLEREDVSDVQVMLDGNLRCVDEHGQVTYRAAGWRPRS